MRNTKLIAGICAVSMVAVNITGCSKIDELKAKQENQESIQEMESMLTQLEDSNVIKHSDKSGKEETVYVLMDANGANGETIVSEWLKNPEGSTLVKDNTTLSDIQVVKGFASYSKEENDDISWTTLGEDVYYQGKTDKELPINVSVSYELDGRPVDANELNNVTGHLTINYDYENRIYKLQEFGDKQVKIYQPFTMITGLLLDGEQVSNVEVTDGKVIQSGDFTIAFGVAMPGLSESLGIEEIKADLEEEGKDTSDIDDVNIPESVTIDADVTNFTLPMSMTIASNNALTNLNLERKDSIDDLKEKSADLEDGMDQLMDGAQKLDDGMHELSDGTVDLMDGTTKLDDGATDLNDGAGELNDGAHELRDGANELRDGAWRLYEGTDKLHGGSKDLRDGLNKLNDKTPELASGVGQIKDGTDQLNAGVGQLVEKNDALNGGAATLAGGLDQLYGTLNSDELKSQLAQLSGGQDQIVEGAGRLNAGLSQMSDKLSAAKDSLPEADQIAGMKQVLNGISGKISEQMEGLDQESDAFKQLYQQKKAVEGAIQVLSQFESEGAINQLVDGAIGGLAQLQEGSTNLENGAKQIQGGIGQLQGKMGEMTEGVRQLDEGANSLKEGISQYTTGVATVGEGAKKLNAGAAQLNDKVPTLVEGVKDLKDGADKLEGGANDLKNGACTLFDGTDKLSDGANELADGTQELKDGTQELKDGTVELKDGVVELTDGVAELVDGTGKLKDGVIEFNDEGISKIVDLLNKDVGSYYDRLCAVRDFADEYTSFTSRAAGENDTVKFIYKMNAVE